MSSLANNNSWPSFLEDCEPNSLTFIKEPVSASEKPHPENEINSFQSASQIVDIDLIDCHEISSMCDLGDDISALDSYFRKKSSSLENLDFMTKQKTKLPTLHEDNSSCSTVRLLDRESLLEKSISVDNITSASISTKAHHQSGGVIIQRHSVHFTITRYSPFSFDFFNIRNLNERAVMLSVQFVIDKRLPSSLTVHKDKLQCLAGDSRRPANMATFIPLETGAYTITIYVFPLWKNAATDDSCHQNTFPSSSSAIVVRCHLNVIDVPIGRPLTNLNGSNVIKLSSFIGLSTRTDVLFRLSPDKQSSRRHQNLRPYTLLLELSGHSELITFSSSAPLMPAAMKWHFVNLRTCSITFSQPSDFVVPMQMKCTADADSTPVVLSISTVSDCGQALHRVQNYQIIVNAYPTAQLLNCSLVQASTEGEEITADQWKRIDLRNKDPTRLVHVNISATLADKEVEWPCWQCTATSLTLPPRQRQTIGVYISMKALAGAALANDGCSRAAVLRLIVQQSAGEGTRLTSVLPLRAICTP